MNSKFIRFVTDKNYLIDDISNGFTLREHPIKFRPSVYALLPSLVEFWLDKKLSSRVIDPIVKNFKSMPGDSFWKWFGNELENNNIFNLDVSHIFTQIRTAKIRMKCFTELRDNQKLHPNHKHWFGSYGICFTSDWMKRNAADRIIYVDNDSEITNRIGRLTSMLSSSFDGKSVIKAVFDVLSYTEISDNSHEYEWRIVGNHHFAGKSYGDYPDVIKFTNDDIICIFVPNENEIDEFVKLLEIKKNSENSKSIPLVKLMDTIFLTDNELEEIKNVHGRRPIVL